MIAFRRIPRPICINDVTAGWRAAMNLALYYCHACGNRLQSEEAEIAIAHGESYSTACCAKCAQAGKRFKDPQAVEAAKLDPPASAVSAENPIPSDSAEISALRMPVAVPAEQAARASRATGVFKRPPAAAERNRDDRKSDRVPAAKSSGFPILPVAGGTALVLIVVVIVLATRSGDAVPEGADSKPETVAANENQRAAPPVPGETAAKPAPPDAPKTPAASSTPAPVAAPTVLPGPAALGGTVNNTSTEMIESHIRYKNFIRAFEQIDAAEKALPKDESSNAPRARLAALREECRKASKASLDELLKTAASKSQAGDVAGVRLVLGPQRLMDLLPEHAQAGERELQSYVGEADAAAKVAEEKRQAELAAMRADFEAKLPDPGALPPALENARVLFGPSTLRSVWSGKESIQKPAGKIPYIDCSKKLGFDKAEGMLHSAEVILEYTSAEPIECLISLEAKEAGWIGGTAMLPAGEMKTETVKLTKDFMTRGKRGDWTGRTFKDLKIDFKHVKPGTAGVFRISLKK